MTNDSPVYNMPAQHLVPVGDYLTQLMTIPPSRMFLINKSLAVYRQNNPGGSTFDASQGDGGASLPGTPRAVLERAFQLQLEHGTAYDMPFGTEAYRKTVVEKYWQLDAATGLGPTNVIGTQGGRDALVKAYAAMLALGHGRLGDLVVVSRVPWISYNWGPYGVGANVLLAPGEPRQGWAYSPEALEACVAFAARDGRKIAGVVITNPDNPTGLTIPVERQVSLAKAALRAGAAFVLFDWMYHYVTDEQPMNLNTFIQAFDPAERKRLMFLDGITKSLGGSNIRNCHLIADDDVIKWIVARASHAVIPSYFSLAVAQAAYEIGFSEAARSIIEPTNESRRLLRDYLVEHNFEHIIGKGYYAFINVGPWLRARGWSNSEQLGQYLAEEHGLAVVPGIYFSDYGADWIRFSYATPPARTLGGAERLVAALNHLARA